MLHGEEKVPMLVCEAHARLGWKYGREGMSKWPNMGLVRLWWLQDGVVGTLRVEGQDCRTLGFATLEGRHGWSRNVDGVVMEWCWSLQLG